VTGCTRTVASSLPPASGSFAGSGSAAAATRYAVAAAAR
jgi:hypothetical protein